MDIRELGRLINESLSIGGEQKIHQSTEGASRQNSESVSVARQELVRQLLAVLKLTDTQKELIDALSRSLTKEITQPLFKTTIDAHPQALTENLVRKSEEIQKFIQKIATENREAPLLPPAQSARAKSVLTALVENLQSTLSTLDTHTFHPSPVVITTTSGAQGLSKLFQQLHITDTPIDLEALKKFIADHIATVREQSPKAGIDLLKPHSNHILEPLMQTLQSIEVRVGNTQDSLSKDLHSIVKNLRLTLSTLIADNASDAEIRKTLELSQKSLVLMSTHTTLPEAIFREITKIDTQIQSLLNLREIDLATGTTPFSADALKKIAVQIKEIQSSLSALSQMSGMAGDSIITKLQEMFHGLSEDTLQSINPSDLKATLLLAKETIQSFSNIQETTTSTDKNTRIVQQLRDIIRDANGLRFLTELRDIPTPEIALTQSARQLSQTISTVLQSSPFILQLPSLLAESSPMTLQLLRNPELLKNTDIFGKEQLGSISKQLESDLSKVIFQQSAHYQPSKRDHLEGLLHTVKITEKMINATIELLRSEEFSPSLPSTAITEPLRDLLTKTIPDLKAFTEAGLGSSKILSKLIDLQLKLDGSTLSKSELKTILNQIVTDITDFNSASTPEEEHPRQELRTTERAVKGQIKSSRVETQQYPTKLDAQLRGELNMLKVVENMIQGQDLIRKLNPVMQLLGEPTFLLFPTLIQGILSRTEISFFSSDECTEEEPKKKKGGSRGSYSCALMVLDLPSLGKLGVHVAHRGEELMIHFTTHDILVRDFIEPRLPKLSTILQSLGFTSTKLSARTGEPTKVTPHWVETIVENNSVIA